MAATASADVTITRLANEGVILESGGTRIMIDGLVVQPYAVYGGLPESLTSDFNHAGGAFADIDLALVSHRHHEHNQPAFACAFMQASPSTLFEGPQQVVDLMREFCRDFVLHSGRVKTISPGYGEPIVIEAGEARVSAFPLTHGTNKYSDIENLGFLVEIGGATVLHIGDAAMEPTDFERAGLDSRKLDVALIPFQFFQPGPGAALVERYLNATLKLAVHIPPSEMEEVKAYIEANFPQVMILEKPLQQVRFSGSASPPP